MDKIFRCHENVSPSYLSNEKSGYISDEMDNNQNMKNKKDNRKVIKKKKNNIESWFEIMNNISETKIKISEQRLELE